MVAAFLPWYATNLGPPFAPESVAGWEATNVAKTSVVMGVIVAVALGRRGRRGPRLACAWGRRRATPSPGP